MIGTTLGPYRVNHELGFGGMGKVYRATSAEGATVALKVIHPHLVADADALSRFRREASVGITIRHPNVVATLAAGESDGRHWLALEYVQGQTLHALQEELGTVPEELCRHVAHEIAAGLAAIHAAGIVHRDMKPENVLITRDNVVKVMDLGVARGAEDDARVTQTGAFVGSLQYAAPEQFTGGGKGLDGRADLHALGVLLYELSAGANPYEDADWRVVFQKVLKETPRRLGVVNPQVSPFFEELVHTLLAKEREQRFASASELALVLEAGEDSAWWASKAKSIRSATHRPLRRIKIPRDTALVGRDIELAKLRAAFEKSKVGEGQVVLVEGEAGIGKSRLVDEFVALLQREGEDLEFLYGSYPPGGAATASGAFSTAYREHFGEAGLAETLGGYLKQTPLLVPAFAALLTNEAPPEGALALTKDSLQTSFVHATRAIAAERIAVVLIDDLHFAPEEGRALFAALALCVPGHRILLVGTSRPPIDEKWASNIVRLGHTTRMGVGRLGAKDLVALLKDALRSARLAEELSLRIAEKTDGNPFFVFEVLRGLKDGQYLTQKPDGTWATTKVIREIQIPSSIADMIQARVGDLAEDERSLLEVAACAGFEFDPVILADACGLSRVPALKLLGQIERQHRLVRSQGRRYSFDHHQVQEALYGGLNEYLREEYHAALAQALEARSQAADMDAETLDGALCAELCEHYLKGARGDSALRYLPPAQSHLRSAYLHAQVVALSDRALAIPGLLTGTERVEVLLRAADGFESLGRNASHRAAVMEAAGLADGCGDTVLRARAHRHLGHFLELVSENDAASAELELARSLAHDGGDRVVEGQATNCLSVVLSNSGRHAEAEARLVRVIELSRERGDRVGEAGATVNLGNVLQQLGRLREAQEHAERGLAICREIGHRQFELNAVCSLGIISQALGRLPESRGHLERGLALGREIGNRSGEAHATMSLGLACMFEGRLCEAREHLERALELGREIGARPREAISLVNLGSVLLELGDRSGARQHLEASLALSREIGMPYPEGYALHVLGSVADEDGDGDAATGWFEESLALRRQLGHEAGAVQSLIALGDLQRRAGDPDGARARLGEAAALAGELGVKADAARALALAACLPAGDAAAAEAALADAGPSGDGCDVRLFLWWATGDRAHLADAQRLLDASLARVPAQHHAAMLTNLRVNREIVAAAQAAGL